MGKKFSTNEKWAKTFSSMTLSKIAIIKTPIIMFYKLFCLRFIVLYTAEC